MTASYHYIAHDDAWDVDLGDQAVRLGAISGFTELAELGAVGGSMLVIDSPADIGHSSDNLLAFQQFAYDDDAAAEPRVFMGWTGARKYYRGSDSLRTGVQRKAEVSLADGNTLAGRRVIQPKAIDASVNRPAETASARIAWLLGTDYFSGVADNGLVLPKSSPTLTANDFSGQHAADVMNDCCTATGDNWFVYWDRTAEAWSLAVFNFTTYNGFAGTLTLSNDPALVDSNLRDGAGPTNTWAVTLDASLTRDPSTLATGVLYAWAGGSVYVHTTSTDYPLIDHTASSTSVKTSALATTKALRYIADNDTEHHRVTCTAQIAAANVNDAYAGQLILASFTHLPDYQAPSYFRIARRTVAQAGRTDAFYAVTYELVPAVPVTPESSFAMIQYPTGVPGNPALVEWRHTGDAPAGGWPLYPKFGLMDYDDTGHSGVGANTGLVMLGSGMLDTVFCQFSFGIGYGFGSPVGHTYTARLLLNGSTVLGTWTDFDPLGDLHEYTGNPYISVSDVPVTAGDILTVEVSVTNATTTIGVPLAIPFWPQWFYATGDLI